LDALCLRKEYENLARKFFDLFDREFKRIIPREKLSITLENYKEKLFSEADRDNKGFLTYWDVFHM
jgi:Ca2+-binding EF-hand superfamily protein